MEVNPLKTKWETKEILIGTHIMYSRDISTIQIAAAAGLDFVVFDLEHHPHDYETIHDLCQTARLTGLAPIVGPEEISQFAISHVLDMGASGVLIPHVETTQDVKTAVEALLYPPQGKRGRAGIAGHNLYNPNLPVEEEVETYNKDISLLLKVESESAIRHLEELVSIDVVNGVMIGPSDLSLDMGIPGQVKHERILELFDITKSICDKRGIQFGINVSSVKDIPDAISSGAKWVIASSEMDLLSEGWNTASNAGNFRK